MRDRHPTPETGTGDEVRPAAAPAPRFWRSLEERRDGARREDGGPLPERHELPPVSRRSFLRAAGVSAAGATLVGCTRAPVEKAIPYLVKPEEVVPGQALWYASTCGGCAAGCGLLVKVRDGRPVKLEGNPAHPVSRGGLCATGQAQLLGLYDRQRLRQPLVDGAPALWPEVDAEVAALLDRARREGRAVRLLSSTVTGPTLRREVDAFLAGFPDARHVVYDPLSASAILDAHERTHGRRALPRLRLERARVVVSFEADFLATWVSPVEHAAGWRAARSLDGTPPRLSYHAQLEGRMSVTGAHADLRVRLAPHEMGAAVARLAARLAELAGGPAPPADAPTADDELERLARRLWDARGEAVLLCGLQDVAVQTQVNLANHLLSSYGSTLDLEQPSLQRQGDDRELERMLAELAGGTVGALLVAGCNPVADLPGGEAIGRALARVPLTVSFASQSDETAAACRFVCPDHHPLESWGDAEPVAGVVAVTQPAIAPLAGTRALVESLAAWRGQPRQARELLRATWRETVLPRQSAEPDFERFFVRAVHDGVVEVDPGAVEAAAFDPGGVAPVGAQAPPANGNLTLVLHPQVGMLSGQHAGNAWLHELPDPVTTVTWDNVAALAPATAGRLSLAEGEVVRIVAATGEQVELPVLLQPGQHEAVVAVAVGYGRSASERFARVGPSWLEGRPSVGPDGRVGVNATPLLDLEGGTLRTTRPVRLEPTGRRVELARTQTHHTITVPERLAPAGVARRDVVQETTLAAFAADPHAGAGPEHPTHSLWGDDHPTTGHRWAMAVDLAACIGCSACVVSCQVENNIPVVGRDEVRRHREMHWLRVDRYFSGDDGDVDVVHQPMLCQHCDNAPCETVCPVLATVHSSEGLNQQVYNRCVGTRYCANNCPYKVRRFNWFDYPREDPLANLVLNPDVTVRSRGVMEKCTFCVQRIQEAKIAAGSRGEALVDGAVQVACQQSCPTRAIHFGDLNDPASEVARAWASPRRYRVLEELGVEPSVAYLRLVRNRDGEPEARHG